MSRAVDTARKELANAMSSEETKPLVFSTTRRLGGKTVTFKLSCNSFGAVFLEHDLPTTKKLDVTEVGELLNVITEMQECMETIRTLTYCVSENPS